MVRRLLCLLVFLSAFGAVGCSSAADKGPQAMTDVIVITTQSSKETVPDTENGSVFVRGNWSENSYAFTEDSNLEIKDLIRNYYNHLAEGDMQLAGYLINDADALLNNQFELKAEYIEEVKSLTCYIMDGMVDGTYIVVAKCGVKTTLGDNVFYMLEPFYVCTNESGGLYICSGDVGDEVKSYNSIMVSDSFISELQTMVSLDNSQAMSDDEAYSELKGIVVFDELMPFMYK